MLKNRIAIKAIKLNEIILYRDGVSSQDIDSLKSDEYKVFGYLEETDHEKIVMYYSNSKLIIFEWTTYSVEVIVSNTEFQSTDFEKIGKYGKKDYGTLLYKNYIGIANFYNNVFHIESKKITDEEFNFMLETVNESISNIAYDYNQPSMSNISRNFKKKTDLGYHIYLFIIHNMKTKNKNLNFFNNFNIVSHNPHRVYFLKKIYENISLVDNIDEDGFVDLLSHTDNLIVCEKNKNKLAAKISNSNSSFLPNEVLMEHTKDTYDNLENRFIKFLILECVRILELFQVKFKNQKNRVLNTNLISENQYIVHKLNNLLKFTYLKYVSDINYIPMNSTILTRKDGYRNLFSFYLGLKSMPSNILNKNLEELIENKSIDVIYEMFCYFSIVNILATIYNTSTKKLQYVVNSNTLSKTLSKKTNDNYFIFEKNNNFPTTKVHYNKTYNNPDSYSKSFDPDISIEVFDIYNNMSHIYIFDAKFKVNINNKSKEKKQYQLDDIAKMHAYKDAIILAQSAFILYPGKKNKIYCEDTLKKSVGALCLNPNNKKNNKLITNILKLLLHSS